MSINLDRDSRRLRIALFVSAVTLVLALVTIGLSRPAWKRIQDRLKKDGAISSGLLGIRQSVTCTGEVDRCTTCHIGAVQALNGPKSPADGERPDLKALVQKHPIPLAKHSSAGVGCASCHGGSGRALEIRAAHALPGSAEKDPFMREPHIEASCVACHIPGDRPGMDHLVRGAKLFSELGCAVCHPLSGEGRGGWDFGPDLRALSKVAHTGSAHRKSLKYLETSVIDPTADFADSTMPSFGHLFSANRGALDDLLVFLESLEVPRSEKCALGESRSASALAAKPCGFCHSGEGGKASINMEHKCLYLKERRAELKCGNCHSGRIGAGAESVRNASVVEPSKESESARLSDFANLKDNGGTTRCPIEKQHRHACAACHDGLDLNRGGER